MAFFDVRLMLSRTESEALVSGARSAERIADRLEQVSVSAAQVGQAHAQIAASVERMAVAAERFAAVAEALLELSQAPSLVDAEKIEAMTATLKGSADSLQQKVDEHSK